MGVPKFYRWLSERYPKINQRYGCPSNPETRERYFPASTKKNENDTTSNNDTNNDETDGGGNNGFAGPETPDPLSTCGLAPEIDRLYLDMNGIIHGCSHNNDDEDQETVDDNGVVTKNQNKSSSSSSSSSMMTAKNTITNPEIFRNVCYYLDRVIGDMVQPKEVVYMAIDGVAPRAKLNQQRGRRYRSGQEGTIEMSIYEAHAKAMQKNQDGDGFGGGGDSEDEDNELAMQLAKEINHNNTNTKGAAFNVEDGYSMEWENTMDTKIKKSKSSSSSSKDGIEGNKDETNLEEVAPGRFKGKFETNTTTDEQKTTVGSSSSGDSDATGDAAFHHNVITPGTEFFSEFTEHLEHFVKYKISTDPKWKNLSIIISGPNVPGEGEHKIMDFIREQKASDDYNPNLRHCIMGQDGDLMMLGLATHEPNLVLLRERVIFNQSQKQLHAAAVENPLDLYIDNAHFEFLHMGVLRDYLAYEFATSNIIPDSPWDLERTIDDFVFMTFFVGNDFLPHMPALDIGDNAFDLLFYKYKNMRKEWKRQGKKEPYLTNAGTIVSGQHLEEFLSEVGSHETEYYDKKKQGFQKENQRLRKQYKRLGMSSSSIPDDDLVASKEQADRDSYRKMLEQFRNENSEKIIDEDSDASNKFMPVLTTSEVDFEPAEEEELEESFMSRMGGILQNSLSNLVDVNSSEARGVQINDQDMKGRYYYDKFQFTPFDAEKHVALRKAYVEGLVWTLKYYYEGCVSWEWYYPYHYGPMLSDLVGLDEILDDISFEENPGKPLKPFEQLMGCMPPSQAHILPEPYRWLMTNPESPILDFYPKTFTIDMNGKRWPWEAVALLPFIDSKRLLDAAAKVDDSQLTQEERERNSFGNTIVLQYDAEQSETLPGLAGAEGFQDIEQNKAKEIPYEASSWNKSLVEKPVLKPELVSGVQVPLPGFGSLRDAPVHSLVRKKLGINVFGSRSRYETSCLEMSNIAASIPPLEMVAEQIVGQTIFINYPYFIEALVTSVSNEHGSIRGENEPIQWSQADVYGWQAKRLGMERRLEKGEGFAGTGGLIIPDDQRMTLSVRPLEGLIEAEDGRTMKKYAKFTIDVPYIATLWKPSNPDPRLSTIPPHIEPNAYEIAPSLHEAAAKQSGLKGRKSLFPPRAQNPTAKGTPIATVETKPQIENTAHEVVQTETASVASLAEPSFGNTHSSVVETAPSTLFPPRTTQSNNPIVSVPSEAKRPNTAETLPPPKTAPHGTTKAVVSPTVQNSADFVAGIRRTILPPKRATISKKGFATLAPGMMQGTIHETSLPGLRTHTNNLNRERLRTRHGSRLAANIRSKSGPRGRLLAAGVVAAGFLFHNANGSGAGGSHCTAANLPKLFKGNQVDAGSKAFDSLITNVRGGDIEHYDTLGKSTSSVPPLEFAHGTTTISFVFQGGIIAAVDSRASLGSFVGSKTTQKVLPVNSHILGTMAGGAADCMFWIRKLKSQALLHELTESSRMSVARASRLLSNALYQNRGLGLSVGTMVMGFDEDETPKIYYVDNTGVRIEGDQFAVGSGGTFALGILDTERRYGLSEDEAIALGIKAIRHATFRDAYSGGFINVFLITKDGWKKVFTDDLARVSGK